MKRDKSTLVVKLLLWFMLCVLIGVTFYITADNIALRIIEKNYHNTEYSRKQEKRYRDDLQNYIKKNNVTINSLDKVDSWSRNNPGIIVRIADNKHVIYDNSYGENSYLLPISEMLISEITTQQFMMGDKDYKLSIVYTNYVMENNVNNIILIVSFCIFIAALLFGVSEKAKYLVTIKDELEGLSKDLNGKITVIGDDEISSVAKGIDSLRNEVIKSMEQEKKATKANYDLVTSISHDIKTPITSIIAQLELLGDKIDDPSLKKYVDVSINKSLQLKDITNELFEHFLIHSKDYQVTFEKVNGGELIVQILEEHFLELEDKGVTIIRNMEDIKCYLSVNIGLIVKLYDNIISNVVKYGDLTKEITVDYSMDKNKFMISISNHKKLITKINTSSKIGLTNCNNIMEIHDGTLETRDNEDEFTVITIFTVENE